MERTYFSNRVYKDTLTTSQVYSTGKALIDFNRAKHKAYKMLLAEHNYRTNTSTCARR
ncbi:MAG: hypothetical protein K6T65_13600 [Peptococcaceae bacterium]|nr:hypothetical protein [Peptococcaceae bacterium]